MKKAILFFAALFPISALAVCNPFVPNTTLTASALNNAISSPCITSGTINGAIISNSPISGASGSFTTLSSASSPIISGTLLSSSNGASLIGFSQAGSGAVATAVQSELRERISVTQFGADTTGISTSVTAFQNTIDSTPNSGIQVIHVPRGTYLGDMTTLTYGSRTVVWQEEGGVTYSTSAPTANRTAAPYLADTSRPWNVGTWAFGKNNTTGVAGGSDAPVLRIQRNTTHSGGGTGEFTGLSVYTKVSDSLAHVPVDNLETALTAEMDSYSSSSSSPGDLAFHAEARKYYASSAYVMGANIVAKDTLNQASSLTGGAIVGAEINVSANDVDDSNNRILVDVIPKKYNLTGVDPQFYAGLRIKPSATGGSPKLKRGVSIEAGGGSVDRGLHVEAINQGVYVSGAPSIAAFQALVTNQATLNLGSTRNSINDTIASVAFSGGNSSAARINYTNTRGVITSDTAGSESGRYDLQAYVAGSLITVAQFSDGVIFGNPTGSFKGTGTLNYASSIYQNGVLLSSATAPTIASGFGTTPSVVSGNGTATFTINVGTGGTASSGVVTMPAATTGWHCTVTPTAAPQAGAVMYSAPTSSTSITITNYTLSTGAALAWPASTVIAVSCVGY